jgi:hypothetical protein
MIRTEDWFVGMWDALAFEDYPGTCLEGLAETTKNPSQDSWCPDRVSSQVPLNAKSSAVPNLLNLFKDICTYLPINFNI